MKRRLFLQGLAVSPAIIKLDSLMLPRNPPPIRVRVPRPIYWTIKEDDAVLSSLLTLEDMSAAVDLYTQDITDQVTEIENDSLVSALRESISRDFHKVLGAPLGTPAKYQICVDSPNSTPYPVRMESHPDCFTQLVRGRIG